MNVVSLKKKKHSPSKVTVFLHKWIPKYKKCTLRVLTFEARIHTSNEGLVFLLQLFFKTTARPAMSPEGGSTAALFQEF